MKNKDELRDELKALSPFLAKNKGQREGYKVPKDYFKNLPDRVLEQIRPQAAPLKRSLLDDLIISLQSFRQPRYAVSFAAALVLILAAVCLFNQKKPAEILQPVAEVRLEDIPDEALFTYVSNHIKDVDKDMILDAVELEKESKPLQKIAPKPNAKELEKYLDGVLEDIDLEDLEDIL